MLKRVRTPMLEVAYEEQGDENAPAVILVHGFPDDARTWDRVTDPLASAGYRTLATYVRGFGETRFLDDDAPRSGQSSAITQDLIEFAAALALDRFILVGHDWEAAAGYIAAPSFHNVCKCWSCWRQVMAWGCPVMQSSQSQPRRRGRTGISGT